MNSVAVEQRQHIRDPASQAAMGLNSAALMQRGCQLINVKRCNRLPVCFCAIFNHDQTCGSRNQSGFRHVVKVFDFLVTISIIWRLGQAGWHI
jgi:hypothetical protein